MAKRDSATRYLALRPDTTTPYSVCIRDRQGNPKRHNGEPMIVRFEPNVIVEVDAELLQAASRAIGPALVVARPSKERTGGIVYDWEATEQFKRGSAQPRSHQGVADGDDAA